LLVYVSQSGSSGEIEPLFANLPSNTATIGITNNPQSLLGQRAGTVLPLCAGEEYTVATKTFLNTLALLNLLSGVEIDTLRQVREQIAALLASSEATSALWLETLADAQNLYFLGHGLHAVTARHCAMMFGEWAKRPVAHASIGAFRHGYIEAVEPRMGVVIFAPPGIGQSSALALAGELAGYGAAVLVVENGHTRRFNDSPRGDALGDEYLSPMLDVIPAQLCSEALARLAGFPLGFRYINKVVTKL
jgi:glucosamine--fructose-6-phosphate aminotransferase (isomerizing)